MTNDEIIWRTWNVANNRSRVDREAGERLINSRHANQDTDTTVVQSAVVRERKWARSDRYNVSQTVFNWARFCFSYIEYPNVTDRVLQKCFSIIFWDCRPTSWTLSYYYVLAMAARRIFFQGWAMRGHQGPWQLPGGGLGWPGGEAPRSWRRFLKMMHKYFVYWGFRQHLQ